jgi:hypothetical protein
MRAAVQAVVQHANTEQADAFARGDPTLIQDTATRSYYQEIAQANRDMAAHGVTAIKLVSLEWGPITSQGANAIQVTTFETWQTTFADSHTEVTNHERNVYTLVQENGAWRIQADDHPDAQLNQTGAVTSTATVTTTGAVTPTATVAPTTTVESVAPALTPSPLPEATGSRPGQSANWSGYAATGGTFTAVTGTWTVPRSSTVGVNGTSGRSGGIAGDATWVGIGGVNTDDLIQAGTEATVVTAGDTEYNAWVELLPHTSQPVPLVVSPGDSITVAISMGESDSWTVAFANNTTAQKYQTTVQYASSESSAEWIEEAPSGRRRLIPLDNFGTVNFSGGSTVKDGKTVTIARSGAQSITMFDRNENPLASPSSLGADGSSFSVSRG